MICEISVMYIMDRRMITSNLHWGVIFIVLAGIYVIKTQQEGFRILGTNMTAEKHTPTYQAPKVDKIKEVPSAPTLSHRHIQTHRTGMSSYCQISNHRRPDEYSTMENGTAKPFEMSSEFFYDCSPNQEHTRTRKMSAPHNKRLHTIRVGNFVQPRT